VARCQILAGISISAALLESPLRTIPTAERGISALIPDTLSTAETG
jgi:hypothetical protein